MADVTDCAASHHWAICTGLTCMIDWLDHWQTLIAGFGAVGAAGISIFYLRKQIAEAASQEAGRRARQLAAARSRLQFTLAEASEYAEEALGLLKVYVDTPRSRIRALAARSRPVVPETALRSFEDVIGATDNDGFAGLMSQLVSEMQVLDSNLRLIANDPNASLGPNLVSFVVRAAKVQGYADTAFPYARMETDQPPQRLDWSRVTAALTLARLYSEHYAQFHEFVERASARANTNN